MAVMSYIQAVTLAMKEEMERDEKVFVLGEDVGKKGGVFKATEGLYDQFGESRVIDTPLAESAIAGVGIGAAMYGMRPVAEMQFADFIMPASTKLFQKLLVFVIVQTMIGMHPSQSELRMVVVSMGLYTILNPLKPFLPINQV